MSLAAADTYCDVLVLRTRGTTGPDRGLYTSCALVFLCSVS